jgi:hypothetical protein
MGGIIVRGDRRLRGANGYLGEYRGGSLGVVADWGGGVKCLEMG